MLDDMAGLIGELEQELDARKQQYEWYRDWALTEKAGKDKRKKLGEIATIERGVRVVRSQLTEDGTYPVFQNSISPLGFHTEYNCKANTTFVIAAGAAGEIGFSTVEFWAADDCYCILCNDGILDDRFAYYCLMSQHTLLMSKVRKASVPRLARTFVEALEIPIPPLPVQEEIVRMLDEMTGLIDELEQEIAARKQQYEYYRDKLLTFPRAG